MQKTPNTYLGALTRLIYKKIKNWKLEVSNPVPLALKPNVLPLQYTLSSGSESE